MPTPEPYLTSRAVRPLASGLEVLGHDPAPLLASAGIDGATLRDPDARVPWSAVLTLIAHAVDVTGDANLGLHIAERAEPGSLDVHFYAMLSSPTLGEAYERLCRYQRLIHETTRVELNVEGERATLRHVMPGGMAAPRQSAEFLVATWVRGGRLATGTDWAPAEVRFGHPAPPDPSHHHRFFGTPVIFGTGENALVLPAALLDAPCLRADKALLAVLDRYAGDRIERAPRTTSFADRARAALLEDLRGGEPSAERLAGRLKTSVRTLNRTLAAENLTYRKLLDHLRQELACRHLADDRVSIAEAAFLLGFSELSAFYRAFKRWTGQTPANFRASQLARPPLSHAPPAPSCERAPFHALARSDNVFGAWRQCAVAPPASKIGEREHTLTDHTTGGIRWPLLIGSSPTARRYSSLCSSHCSCCSPPWNGWSRAGQDRWSGPSAGRRTFC